MIGKIIYKSNVKKFIKVKNFIISMKQDIIVIRPSKTNREKEAEMIIKWKKLCEFKYGYGGIKKRIFEIIEEDLNNQKNEKI